MDKRSMNLWSRRAFMGTLLGGLAGCATPSELLLKDRWADRGDGWSDRVIEFSGRPWRVRQSHHLTGAGPNLWGNTSEHVRVDPRGALHMGIRNGGGRWSCAEIATPLPDGFARVTIELESSIHNLDPNVIAALFLYRDDRNELDIEFARWGRSSQDNAQYVVAPPAQGRLERFTVQSGPSTHTIDWRASGIDFHSTQNNWEFARWRHQGLRQPAPGGFWVHLNLWLFEGKRPLNAQEVDWVVRRVTID